jgi:mitochondrial fission protein ELM1
MTTNSLRANSDLAGNGPAAEPAIVWALLARRPGDNAQVEAFARASGLPWAGKRLAFRKGWEAAPNLRRGGSLFSLTSATQATLRATPQPQVVIAAGKRSAPAALWLKAATGARLVHLGRTWAPPDWFDLVITTPQYRQPGGPNVVVNLFPLTPQPPGGAGALDESLERLPRPHLTVVVGGDAPGLSFDGAAAERLIGEALAHRERAGGSLLVVTSPRTSPRAVAALRAALARSDAPHRLSVFGDGANEYRAFLAAADAFLVTGDSVSMIAEAAMTGRPVTLFPLRASLGGALSPLEALARSGGALARFLVERGLLAPRPDLAGYAEAISHAGLLDGGPTAAQRMAAELASAAERVRALAGGAG